MGGLSWLFRFMRYAWSRCFRRQKPQASASRTGVTQTVSEQGHNLYREGERLIRQGDWQHGFCKWLDCYDLWLSKRAFLVVGGNEYTFSICAELGKLLMTHGSRDDALQWFKLNLEHHAEFYRKALIRKWIFYCSVMLMLYKLLENFQPLSDRRLLSELLIEQGGLLAKHALEAHSGYDAEWLARAHSALGEEVSAKSWQRIAEQKRSLYGF